MEKFAALILLLCSAALMAAEIEEDEATNILPPPELPRPVQSGESLTPEVTIRTEENKTIEEYRIKGTLYMVKITPNTGPAYFIVDSDGDGNLETRFDSPHYEDVAIPQWVILSW